MAAAYAAVVSLQHTIETIQQLQHDCIYSHLMKRLRENPLIEVLRRRANFLQEFLEEYNFLGGHNRDAARGLEGRIADAAHAAEDIIESHVVGRILAAYPSINQEASMYTSSEEEEEVVVEEEEKYTWSEEEEEVAEEEEKEEKEKKKNFIKHLVGLPQAVMKKIVQFKMKVGRSTQTADATNYAREVDRILDLYSSGGYDKNSSIHDFDQHLEKVTKVMEVLIEEEVKKITKKKKTITENHEQPRNSVLPSSSSSPPPKGKNVLLGFDDYLTQIMDELTRNVFLARRVMSIIGMGGIGKTTLAKNVYVNPLIVQYFDLRAWTTISQEYSVREILSCLLRDIDGFFSDQEGSEDELGETLYKELCGKRYLIVLDDMWSVEAWDKVKFYFPDNKNGSRIVITTRISNLACHFGSCVLKVDLLDDDRSWNLLSQKVFGDEGCPGLELEELGKKIAKKCKGLPLSIVTIAGLLAKSEKTPEYWGYVLENLNSMVTLDDNERCSNILSLSYSHLPVYLKPCFLYMGVFPEDYKISVSKLIKLWVAEGFLKPDRDKSLEEFAEECLHDLVGRNLVLVHGWGSHRPGKKIKTCYIHDLLRDLSIRESQKQKFLFVAKDLTQIVGKNQRRIVVQLSTMKNYTNKALVRVLESASLVRSLSTYDIDFSLPLIPTHRLLRVFSDQHIRSVPEIFLHVNSRYLEFGSPRIPPSINQLWNLQTLYIYGASGYMRVPVEIWGMTQLRHLMFRKSALLPIPPRARSNRLVLGNLQKITFLSNFKITENVIRRIPNVKKLGICHDADGSLSTGERCVENLDRMVKLESLSLSLWHSSFGDIKWKLIKFPLSLKKLILIGGCFPWESMRIISLLPHLEVLKLQEKAFIGDEWNSVEGEFLCLKFLEMYYCHLKYWNADETCFPCLELLVIKEMSCLTAIPSDIGQIPTLQSIFVDKRSPRAFSSAKDILKEQVSFGNESLQVLTEDGPISLEELEDSE